MRVRHDFRDGNDPSNYPGARVFVVKRDLDFVTEVGHQRVTHRATGDVLEYELEDRELHSFLARLIDGPRHPLVIRGTSGLLDKGEGSSILAFNIFSTSRFGDGTFLDAPVSLLRIGKFLNTMATAMFPHSCTDPILIIDNRAIKDDGNDQG